MERDTLKQQRQNWLGPPFQKRRAQTLFWKNLGGHYEDITFFQNNVYILCKPKLNTKVIWDFRANSKTYLEIYISKTRKQVVVLFFQLYTPIQKEISRLFGFKQQYPFVWSCFYRLGRTYWPSLSFICVMCAEGAHLGLEDLKRLLSYAWCIILHLLRPLSLPL